MTDQGNIRPNMGNIPVVHEVCTSFGSLGDAVVGKPENARQRWRDYAEESFFGSGIYAAHEARLGNKERARELGKGMGRATGKILCGGGLLKEIPVLHELATCGASLGDMIGGGDQHSARDRWEEYKEESVLGSGIQAAIEHKHGNQERSRELRRAMGRASTKAGITAGCTAGAIAVTIATAGAGTGVAIAASASAGSACGAAATAGVQAVDGKINSADVIGSMLLGGLFLCSSLSVRLTLPFSLFAPLPLLFSLSSSHSTILALCSSPSAPLPLLHSSPLTLPFSLFAPLPLLLSYRSSHSTFLTLYPLSYRSSHTASFRWCRGSCRRRSSQGETRRKHCEQRDPSRGCTLTGTTSHADTSPGTNAATETEPNQMHVSDGRVGNKQLVGGRYRSQLDVLGSCGGADRR